MEIQFGGDYDAFPIWGRDANGYFDVNLPRLRRELSPALAADLGEWTTRWAEVDGGDREDDGLLTEALITEARQLADRVQADLGSDYVVSVRWAELRP